MTQTDYTRAAKYFLLADYAKAMRLLLDRKAIGRVALVME